MCLQVNSVRPYQKWRWAGDEIVFDTIVRAARFVPDTRKRYEIDIRQYLSSPGNAILREWIYGVAKELPSDDRLQFVSRGPGSYDFRAHQVIQSMRRLSRKPSNRMFDQWMFPDETIANGGGDCEDLAFLIAALLEESGVSRQCIRVALGAIVDHSGAKPAHYDHAWVVYQTEGGGWEILEPFASLIDSKKSAPAREKARAIALRNDVEYIPHFVFNRDHLWRVRSPDSQRKPSDLKDYLKHRDRFWTTFNPAFAAAVHNDIFDQALVGMSSSDLALVKRTSFLVDVNVLAYDPRDHFDFAYIPEGWQQVEARLRTKSLKDFALAAHAIGDFYAHSLWGYYTLDPKTGSVPVYDKNKPLTIDNGFIFDSYELPGCSLGQAAARAKWEHTLITGQWWRWYTGYPSDLKNPAELRPRRCLPDHDALAVDGPKKASAHRLFPTDAEYAKQFAARRAAAINHVRRAYNDWKV